MCSLDTRSMVRAMPSKMLKLLKIAGTTWGMPFYGGCFGVFIYGSLPIDIDSDRLFPKDPEMYPFDVDMPLYIAIDIIKASAVYMLAPANRHDGT